MNSMFPQTGSEFAILPTENNIENLVSDHFEKIYAFFDAFFQDHRISIKFTENAFLSAFETGNSDNYSLYQWAAERVRTSQHAALAGGLPLAATACLLLKELGSFRYHEIAEIMELETAEVKHNIAQCRQAMIGLMS